MKERELITAWREDLPETIQALFARVLAVTKDYGVDLFIVGGFVRDMIRGDLNRGGLDIDLVVEGNAIQVVEELERRHGGAVCRHTQFGTAKWQIQDVKDTWQLGTASDQKNLVGLPDFIDFASARKEVYLSPGELPKVTPGKIEEDLFRRDFSINALALRIVTIDNIELIDPFSGLEDIKQGVIRILHKDSFRDDPTRIFRAVRYEQRLEYRIEGETKDNLIRDINYINRLSGDRIRHEFNAIARELHKGRMMLRLQDLGVLAVLYPGGGMDKYTAEIIERCLTIRNPRSDQGDQDIFQKAFYGLWLSHLEKKTGEYLIERLNMDRQLRKVIEDMGIFVNLPTDFWAQSPGDIALALDEFQADTLKIMAQITEDENKSRILEKYIREWKDKKLPQIGMEIYRRGIRPGPIYHEIINKMRIAIINHNLQDHNYIQYLELLLSGVENEQR